MISLGLQVPGGRPRPTSRPRCCPPTAATIGGNDVLIAAQPYANADDLEIPRLRIADDLDRERARPASDRPGGPRRRRRRDRDDAPQSQVVFDNPKNLPEPWNPTPC